MFLKKFIVANCQSLIREVFTTSRVYVKPDVGNDKPSTFAVVLLQCCILVEIILKTYLCINCYILINVADTSSCYRSNFRIRDKTFYFIKHKTMSFYLSHYVVVVVEIILSKNHKQLRNMTLYYHIVT